MDCGIETVVFAAIGAIAVTVWGVKAISRILTYVHAWRRLAGKGFK